MADVNPKVMEMVRAELTSNPDISNQELRDKATSIDRDIDQLSARQFNARYPLQVKRQLNPPKRRKRKKPAAAGRKARRPASNGTGSAGRDKVRNVLLELARDVANAQGKGEVVDVIVGIDKYVDRVVKAAG